MLESLTYFPSAHAWLAGGLCLKTTGTNSSGEYNANPGWVFFHTLREIRPSEIRFVPHPDRTEGRAKDPRGGVQSLPLEIGGRRKNGGTDIRRTESASGRTGKEGRAAHRRTGLQGRRKRRRERLRPGPVSGHIVLRAVEPAPGSRAQTAGISRRKQEQVKAEGKVVRRKQPLGTGN